MNSEKKSVFDRKYSATVAEIAEACGVTDKRMYQLIETGKISRIKDKYNLLEGIKAFIDAKKLDATSSATLKDEKTAMEIALLKQRLDVEKAEFEAEITRNNLSIYSNWLADFKAAIKASKFDKSTIQTINKILENLAGNAK